MIQCLTYVLHLFYPYIKIITKNLLRHLATPANLRFQTQLIAAQRNVFIFNIVGLPKGVREDTFMMLSKITLFLVFYLLPLTFPPPLIPPVF